MSGDGEYLAYDEVVQKLGRALFGDEWIDRLTAREAFVLECSEPEVLASVPGGVSFARDDAPSMDELRAARTRQSFRSFMVEKIKIWLSLRNIETEVLNGEECFRRLEFDSAYSSEFAEKIAAPIEETSTLRKGGGRPRKWDWDGFAHEVWARLFANGLPTSQAHLEREMLEWFEANNSGAAPSPSQVREHVAPILKEAGARLKPHG